MCCYAKQSARMVQRVQLLGSSAQHAHADMQGDCCRFAACNEAGPPLLSPALWHSGSPAPRGDSAPADFASRCLTGSPRMHLPADVLLSLVQLRSCLARVCAELTLP